MATPVISEGGFRISGPEGEFHVSSLSELQIHSPSGESLDVFAVAGTEASRSEMLRRRGYVEVSVTHAEIMQRILQGLAARLADDSELSPATVADTMIAAIPDERTGRRWQELIGPFYSANDIATWRGVSRQHIHKLREQGRLLAVQTLDGKKLFFPAWQFGPAGEELPHLREVVQRLGMAAPDEWAQALWLNLPTDRFEGRRAVDLMKAGEFDRVVAAARSDAARMAS